RSFGDALRGLELLMERALAGAGLCRLQARDHPAPRCSVRRFSDGRLASGEEFLLLELYALPRRVPEHDIEAAGRHHVGEFERQMENARGTGEVLGATNERAVNGTAGQRLP